MATNTKPGAGVPVFDLTVTPSGFDEVVARQGQWARVISARKCPNLEYGRHDMYCKMCGGKKVILDFQRRRRVIDEVVGDRCAGSEDIINTWWNPILEIERIYERLHDVQGGSQFYTVASFTGNVITLAGTSFPVRYNELFVTYWIDRWKEVTDEDVVSDGTSLLRITGSTVSTADNSNVQNTHGDITIVTSVYNVTQDYTYTVKSFGRRDIYLETAAGGYVNASGDTIRVSYWYSPAEKVASEMISTQEKAEKWGHDVKVGDVQANTPSWMDIGEGDIVTFLTTELRKEFVVKRGGAAYDELPAFDVTRIFDNFVQDEDGVRYVYGTDFTLSRYNDFVWLDGGSQPAVGKRYSGFLNYHPAYRVFLSEPNVNNAEDKFFPRKTALRLFDKVTDLDFVAVSQ